MASSLPSDVWRTWIQPFTREGSKGTDPGRVPDGKGNAFRLNPGWTEDGLHHRRHRRKASVKHAITASA
eukprot:scaffold644_cov357-Pavlova_lutheri.AAC.36